VARKPVYERMSRRELIERMNAGDKVATELYGALLDKDEAKFFEEYKKYESTHDVVRQHEFDMPLMNVIFSLNPNDENYHALLREQFELLDNYHKEHGEAIEIITNLEQGKEGTELYKFVQRLTRKDFKEIIDLDLSDDEWALFEADRVGYFQSLYIADCVTLYEAIKRQYRTRRKAQEESTLADMPQVMAITTLKDYRNSISFYQKGKAYMIQFDRAAIESMKFEDGKLLMPVLDKPGVKPRLKALSKLELQNVTTKEGIEKIDLPFLVLIYTIYLKEYEKNGFDIFETETISIYIPDLAKTMKLKSNLSQEDIKQNILAKFDIFHSIRGVVVYNEGGKRREGYLQVLNVEEYNPVTNVLTISSPYIKRVLKETYEAAKRRDRNNNVKLSKSGTPLLQPMHSYLALPSLVKEHNKAAVENVFIILALIEEAGSNTANIKARTIVERNVQLAERLRRQDTRNANIILRRCFLKTWELLATQTKLSEKYQNIKIPNPTIKKIVNGEGKEIPNPAAIPTMATLDMVFRFEHDGIVKD